MLASLGKKRLRRFTGRDIKHSLKVMVPNRGWVLGCYLLLHRSTYVVGVCHLTLLSQKLRITYFKPLFTQLQSVSVPEEAFTYSRASAFSSYIFQPTWSTDC